MKPKVSIITLGVRDFEAALRFYRDGLGFPLHGDAEGHAMFALEGSWLSLYPREELAKDAGTQPEGAGFSGFALAHNVRSEAEVDAVLEEAQRAGGKVVKPGERAFWGGYSGYFADPDGFLWEVACNTGFAMADDGSLILPD